VTSRRLRDGNSIGFTYDNLNRVTFKDLPGTEPDVTYAYDNLSRPISVSQTGNSLSFTYDALSRQLTEVGPQGTITSAYDPAGNRTQITYPGTGLYVNYDYLANGALSAIRENGATAGVGVLASYGYDNLGRRTSITFGNGATQVFTYDAVSRLATLSNDLSGTTNDLSVTYSYNPASQITQAVRTGDAYAYGGDYDVNRGYTSNGLNQYTASGSAALTYGAKGNLANDGTNTYCHSSQSLLISISTASDSSCATPTATLTYDPQERLYQAAGAATTRFAYDGGNMLAEYDGSNALQRRFVFDPLGQPIVDYEGSGTTSRRFLSADERGSIISATDSSGSLIAINTYDEYGIPGSANSGRFGFTGQAWLSEVGMQYSRARIYSPTLGRFIEPDPIGYGDGPNWYAYTHSDPVNGVDPLGLQDADTDAIIVTGTRLHHNAPIVELLPALPGLATILAAVAAIPPPNPDPGGSGTPNQPTCTLVPPTGNFQPDKPTIDARFTPQTAAMLSSALATLNKEGITPVMTSGYRSPDLQASLRSGNSKLGGNPGASILARSGGRG
jgi:RHS repeat-associated protein